MRLRSVTKAVVAFLLSILTPGLGQIYNGQLTKGALCLAGLVGLFLVSTLAGLAHHFAGFILHSTLVYSLYLFTIAEAALTAVRQVRADRRPVHTWRSYILGISLLATWLFVAENIPDKIPGVRGYSLPAESMAPTLISGDRIFVDMKYYGSHSPRRGDLIIFKFPYQDHPNYIKRVIGVPGDHIKIVDQQVYLNGEKQNEAYVRYDSTASYDPLLYNFPPGSHDEPISSMQPEWADQIGKYVQNGELVVPPGNYFTLGDNRDHSWDSRYWGPVTQDKIFGKALFIYWSSDKSRIGKTVR